MVIGTDAEAAGAVCAAVGAGRRRLRVRDALTKQWPPAPEKKSETA
jgi:hypothetical protein